MFVTSGGGCGGGGGCCCKHRSSERHPSSEVVSDMHLSVCVIVAGWSFVVSSWLSLVVSVGGGYCGGGG